MDLEEQKQNENYMDYSETINGPLPETQRQKRDFICSLLFLINLVWMMCAAAIAFSTGNPANILRPYQLKNYSNYYQASYTNNICGYPQYHQQFGYQLKDYPYAFYYHFDMLAICVKSCPLSMPANAFLSSPAISISFDRQVDTFGKFTSGGQYADGFTSYDSYPAFDRICMPSVTALKGALSPWAYQFASLKPKSLGVIALDIKNNWMGILLAFGFSVLVSFLLLLGIHFRPFFFLWISAVGISLSFFNSMFVFFYTAGRITGQGTYSGFLTIPFVEQGKVSYYSDFAWVSFGIFIIFICVLCFIRRQVKQTAQFCKIISNFIRKLGSIFVILLLQVLLILMLWGFCLSVIVYQYAILSRINTHERRFYWGPNHFSDINIDINGLTGMFIFILSTFWCNFFIKGVGEFVMASIYSQWYYYKQKQDKPFDALFLNSYKIAIKYHLGSIAVGSSVTMLLSWLSRIINIAKWLTTFETNNKCTDYIKSCFLSCLSYVQCFDMFINKHAYVQMAIRGKNYYHSAMDSYQIQRFQKGKYSPGLQLGSFFSFFNSVFVAALIATAFNFLVIFEPSIRINVLQPIYLIVIVFFLTYTASTIMFSVYSTTMDTFATCFIIGKANSKEEEGRQLIQPMEAMEQMLQYQSKNKELSNGKKRLTFNSFQIINCKENI